MVNKNVSFVLAFSLLLALMSTFFATNVQSWSNGGYSANPSNPDYGTHDWIAQHALDWLPAEEKQYILDNLAAYLYGTELPDNSQAADGIGDTTKHHIYYNSAEVMTDDASAVRASTEYINTLNFLRTKDYANAAKNAGIMSHYIVDIAVFGHVMGSSTDWGTEVHHSDYETYVNSRTSGYSAEFNSFLSFDDSLTTVSAYDAAKNLAYDTTFDVNGDLNCTWMDQNYNWSNPAFKNRVGESLNLAVNYLSDVLHSLYLEATTTPTLPVHNINTDEDFAAIQTAINDPDTSDGHTILVDSGIYYEHVVVNKTVTLVGENRSTTIIDGGNVQQYVVEVKANGVNITGFTVRNSAQQMGIGVGVYLSQANSSWVSKNNIVNNSVGIQLDYSSYNTIESNNISSNGRRGILLFESSDYNIVTKNEAASNFDGVEILHSSHNVISENMFHSNLIDGIRLYASGGVTGNNTIIGNTISENKAHGIALYYASSSNNQIFHNNFKNNSIQAFTSEATNTWDNGYPSGGNYWSDYMGVDNKKGPSQNQTGSDGIGDTPHIIDENNRDRYPLTYQWPDLTKPVADAGTDQTTNVNSPVAFNASGSTDNVYIISYEWNFGDDSTGIGMTTNHTYTQAGTYNVTLTVADSAGNTSTDTLTVTVSPLAEAFPMWAIGAAALLIAGIAIGAILIIKRKP